ncbi:MAG TPA: hypothetical protein PKA74_05855, partial [Bauldia sp.]|nr:hypothetical protein [Bauldia sp.]
MRIVWQYSRTVMVGRIQVDASRQIVSMSSDLFASLLRSSIAPVFDERWYLEKYPDVGKAIRNGTIRTALEHYVEHGFYENRMPYAIRVDETYYAD